LKGGPHHEISYAGTLRAPSPVNPQALH
jgi:hypothetical protein